MAGGVTPQRLARARIEVVATRFGLSSINRTAFFNLGASFGYRVGKPIAIALIENQSRLDGLKVDVDIAGSQNAGTIHTAATWNSIG
jgi:hypothetical protein